MRDRGDRGDRYGSIEWAQNGVQEFELLLLLLLYNDNVRRVVCSGHV